MALVFVLPSHRQTDSALDIQIPSRLGIWRTESLPVSKKELSILADDTQFSKANCAAIRMEEYSYSQQAAPYDYATISIVLSGHDLANSIHRPERCMAAQGHHNLVVTASDLELPNDQTLPIKRITSRRDLSSNPDNPDDALPVSYLTYYFFVGHDQLTADHMDRTFIDIKDRLTKGEAQRWAYVLATIAYSDSEDRQIGSLLPTFEMADKKIRQLISDLAERNINWDQISS